MRIIVFILASTLYSNIANAADQLSSFQTATRLASVIGSEKYCNFKYHQPAIEKYIESHVEADDMSFPEQLSGAITLVKFGHKSRSKSAKTAHCAQIKRLAKSYHFID